MTEYEGRVERALELKAKTLWVEFGRPSTPWDTEASPPSPTPGATDVDIPYLYVKATYKTLCREAASQQEYDDAGLDAVTINATQYVYITDEDAYDELAYFVFIRTTIDVLGVGHPAGTFRQFRLFSGLEPTMGHENDLWLLPANVSAVGKRVWVDTCPPEITSVAAKKSALIIIELT